jgi:hemoglobin
MAAVNWLSGLLIASSAFASTGLASATFGCGGFFGGSDTSTASDDTGEIREEGTLYERLGGVDALRALVDAWLQEAGSDPRIRDFFGRADVGHLKLRLVERICVQVQGPCLYRGREMYEVHADLGLEDTHLRAFLQVLEPAMQRVLPKDAPRDELREVIRGLAEELAIAVVR